MDKALGNNCLLYTSLSAYRDDRPLSDWLVDQLANNYELPRRLAAQWIDAGRFVPLLDGLDEVDPALRPACAEAINAFRRQHPGVWLLVTARSRDYQTPVSYTHLDVYKRQGLGRGGNL